ncbi:response regulator transcription factor [Flavobacterium sp.]|uniref:helix-turn-helix transcriptional regulator n=1 Tax=Flavobacterium sp. TaxID=239 RepID=UPI0011F5A7F7|nr:response regulator transcription factor [Flavobacterium sp.]RZJ72699.1 MAG: response regulator transcription factor [Flavobacterium sp.]
MKPNFVNRNKEIVAYAIFMGVALAILRFLEIRFFFFDFGTEILVGGSALLFMAIGIWVTLKLAKPKTIVIEKEIARAAEFCLDQSALQTIGISKRELEVLQLMSKGHSNTEIASQLFVSLNTIKTHASNIFEKLEVNRRTQAVEKARQLRLIP